VFRFLNGCSGDEIIKFMDMVFESFKHFISGKINLPSVIKHFLLIQDKLQMIMKITQNM
jgi:hypothetical protein